MAKLKNKLIWLFAVAVIAVVAMAVVLPGDAKPKPKTAPETKVTQSACGPYRADKDVWVNGHVFHAELPNSPAAFDKGLGGRPCILTDQAMLFSFNKASQYSFWMKDMKFPIDIVWIDSNHRVVAMEIDEQPSTYPDKFVNQADRPAQYVLEIKAKLSNQLHMDIGTLVQF